MLGDALVTVYLLSATGSVAWFGTGYSAGRLLGRARERGPVVLPPSESATRSASAAEAELDALRSLVESTTNALRAEEERSAGVRAVAEASRGELEACRAEHHRIQEQVQALQSAAREAELRQKQSQGSGPVWAAGSEGSLDVGAQILEAQGEVRQLRQQLGAERAARARQQEESRRQRERASAREVELGRCRQQLQRTTTELDTARARQAELEAAWADHAEEAATMRRGATPDLEAAVERCAGLLAELEQERLAQRELQREIDALRADQQRRQLELESVRRQLKLAVSEREDLEVRQAGAAAYVRRAQEAASRQGARARELVEELRLLRESPSRSDPPGARTVARIAELERELALLRAANQDALREETRQLRLRISQLEPRAAAAARLEADNLSLRDRAEELERDAAELEPLRQRIATLEARLFVLDERVDAAVETAPSGPASAGPSSTVTGLAQLVAVPGVRCAVLAEGHGLPVTTQGDPAVQEGLAAMTGLAGRLAATARQLLPLAEVEEVTFRDRNSIVVACRLFDCHGDAMALATLGTGLPTPERMEAVMLSVLQALALPAETSAAL